MISCKFFLKNLFCICLCVWCVCMCIIACMCRLVYVGACKHVSACTGRLEADVRAFLDCFSHYSLKQILSIEPRASLYEKTKLAGLPQVYSLGPQSTGITRRLSLLPVFVCALRIQIPVPMLMKKAAFQLGHLPAQVDYNSNLKG